MRVWGIVAALLVCSGSAHADGAIKVVRPDATKATTEKTHAFDVVERTYANNTRCYIKRTTDAGNVVCRFTFLGGVSEEDEKTRCLTEAGMAALQMGAHRTAKHGPADFKALFDNPTMGIVPSLGLAELNVDVVAAPDRIEDFLFAARLLVLGAQLSDGTFDSWRSQIAGVLAHATSNVQQQALWARVRAATGGDIRVLPPDFRHIANLKHPDAQRWLDRMLREAPLTVSFAGNVAPERARELMDAYVGSLPARPAKVDLDGRRRTGPWPDERERRVTIASRTPAAATLVGWPVHGRKTLAQQAALHVGASVIQRRVAAKLTETLGTPHRPSFWYDRLRFYQGGDGLWFFTLTSPRHAEQAADVARAEVRALVAGQGAIDELADVRKAFDTDPDAMIAGRWAYELGTLPVQGWSVADFAEYTKQIASMDADAVRAALADVCKDEDGHTILVSTPKKKRGPDRVLKAGEEGDLYVEGSDFPSRVYLPEDWTGDKKLPVVLFLHGSGATPTTNIWRTATGGRGAVIVALAYGGQADGGASGRVLGDPDSCRAGHAYIEKVRAALEERYGTDPDRVVLSGFSMGGWAVNYYGFLEDAKGRYAGFAILGAGTTEAPTVDLSIAKGVPVLLLNGRDDVNLARANAGLPLLQNAGAKAKQVILEGQGHIPSDAAMAEPLSAWLEGVLAR